MKISVKFDNFEKSLNLKTFLLVSSSSIVQSSNCSKLPLKFEKKALWNSHFYIWITNIISNIIFSSSIQLNFTEWYMTLMILFFQPIPREFRLASYKDLQSFPFSLSFRFREKLVSVLKSEFDNFELWETSIKV